VRLSPLKENKLLGVPGSLVGQWHSFLLCLHKQAIFRTDSNKRSHEEEAEHDLSRMNGTPEEPVRDRPLCTYEGKER
jgi:hypothetical protein